MAIEHASNIFSTFGGMAGAGWGIGWKVGKTIAGDYRSIGSFCWIGDYGV